MKYSRQRDYVLKTLQKYPIHPTADFIYEKIREDIPNISLGTVYRNLNQLVENGLVRALEGIDDSIHFDHDVDKHYHFICRNCNKIFDIPYNIATDLSSKVKLYTGLDIEECEINCKGLCDHCKKYM